MAVDIWHGSTITFGSSFFAQIRNMSWTGLSRPVVDTTHSGTTTARTFMPGDLYDGGSWQIDGLHDTTKNPITPMTSTAETTTITLPTGAGQTTAQAIAFSGFMESYSPSGDTADGGTPAEFSAVIKVAGPVTVTTAA